MIHRKPSSDVRAEPAFPRVPAPEARPGQTRDAYADYAGQARNAYAHYARLAELHAYCHAQALAGRRYTAAVGSERNYRRAARKCRLLGELMRGIASSHEDMNGSKRNLDDLPLAELAQTAREVMRGQRAA
jgi:hypothetical protein